ncbi:unnamed protein product [Echinostoma caproni]|uniref:Uncharacterized protein n=1 Tax=Echinostoma caproni TaxID=27848 RepID=A0A182ZZZ3_9TREM|nr:unnamed protein product [Echinostoma caproni]
MEPTHCLLDAHVSAAVRHPRNFVFARLLFMSQLSNGQFCFNHDDIVNFYLSPKPVSNVIVLSVYVYFSDTFDFQDAQFPEILPTDHVTNIVRETRLRFSPQIASRICTNGCLSLGR